MTRPSGKPLPSVPPGPGDDEQASRHLERWNEANGLDGDVGSMLEGPTAGEATPGLDSEALLKALFGNSPFLTELAFAEPDVITSFLQRGPDRTFEAIIAAQVSDRRRPVLMAHLRKLKRRAALLTALADISGVWSLGEVTAALTRLADLAAGAALDLALRELA
ncbi:MAG: glutamine-synthetase adenylyltransferase, partial [Pseudomonadota bacterium]